MLSGSRCKKLSICLIANVFLLCVLLAHGNCTEDYKKGIVTKEKIIEILRGGDSQSPDDEIRTMGPRSTTKIVFGTEKGGNTDSGVQGSIPFAYNSHEITESAIPQLNELGKALSSAFTEYTFEISGHTDIRGPTDYNQQLSLKRAKAVKAYLVKHFHIPDNHLIAKGYGKTQNIADGTDEASHARNRRVEIVKIGEVKQLPKAEKVEGITGVQGSKPQKRQVNLVAQFLYFDEKSRQMRQIESSGSTILQSGKNPYQIFFSASQPCYVYVLQKSTDGKWQLLFPQKDASSRVNPIKPGTDYWLPGYDSGFQLDETKGHETIYVLASQAEISDLESCRRPVELAEARLPTDAHQVKTMGTAYIGKPETHADLSDNLNCGSSLDRAIGQGSLLKSISFVHE